MPDETTTGPLTIGSRIRDNDPRVPACVFSVTKIDGAYVYATDKNRKTRIRRDRIHTDGKARRSGWSLVQDV